jgi:hypothetical protein
VVDPPAAVAPEIDVPGSTLAVPATLPAAAQAPLAASSAAPVIAVGNPTVSSTSDEAAATPLHGLTSEQQALTGLLRAPGVGTTSGLLATASIAASASLNAAPARAPTLSGSSPARPDAARGSRSRVPHAASTPAPRHEPNAANASASASAAGGGSTAPMVFAILCAALAVMAQLARTIVRAPSFARSVSLVLVVERPG